MEKAMKEWVTVEGVKKTLFGIGAVEGLMGECEALRVSRVLLVMDKDLSRMETGLRVQEMFERGPIRAVPYFEVTPEPSPSLADSGAGLAKKEEVHCVIGVGGGSTMDVAKAVAVLVTNGGKAEDYLGLGRVKGPGLPTIMVPTTAGTGSEATFTSVFTMRERRAKGGINSPFLYPHTAILDPELTLDLPPETTAYTGMDALTHAMESLTSLQANFMSEPLSMRAIELIARNLRGAVFQGRNLHYRNRMMQGSYLAGLGLAMAGVGAVHALAYPLGALFDIPHGLANAVLLPYVLEYNYPGDTAKFARIAAAMGQEDPGSSERDMAGLVVRATAQLGRDIGIPLTLEEMQIPEASIPEMARAAMEVARPMMNNPRPMTAATAEQVYRRAFEGR